MPLTTRRRSSVHIVKNGMNVKRNHSFNKGKSLRKGSDGEILVPNAPSELRSIWYPGGVLALGLLLAARLLAAYTGHIADCDETYNYWEPLHYLVYGSGLQTWEYSPAFALRSYLPLWLLAVPAKMLSLVFQPVTVFYCVRAMLAVLLACAELMFYKAVCHSFGVHVGRLWLLLTLPAAGSAAIAGALLPSACSAGLLAAAMACWWRKRARAAVWLVATSALLSWPFTALIGVPIAIDLVFLKRQYKDFFKWSLTALAVILVPTVIVDSWHYGRPVVAPWNIVAYNVLTGHGPDLYGVEPWTYYIINGFLNFNIVWVLALSCPILLPGWLAVSPRSAAAPGPSSTPQWLALTPPLLWLAVFMAQPHKEERFLYPVYPMLVLSGAVALDCAQRLAFAVGSELFRWRRGERRHYHYLAYTASMMVGCVLLAGLCGISRLVALHRNYSAPMRLLSPLPIPPTPLPSPITLCYGKEWHRAPSSFHLPEGYRVRFIPSEFKGQLPAPYSDTHDATRLVHPYFNDMNVGNNSTYLKASQCDYLVDSDIGTPSAAQPAYHLDPKWEVVAQLPILDAERSPRLFRAFYVPGFSSTLKFANLYLLKNTKSA